MRAGMVGIFTLHQQRRRRNSGDVAFGTIERRRAPDEIAQDRIVLVPELRIGERLGDGGFELLERRDQNLGNVAAAELAEITARVGTFHASRTARTKATIFSTSLRSSVSIPLRTSTP